MFPCPRPRLGIWSREMVRQSRSASACPFSILGLNLVLTYGIPPDFRGGVHLFIASKASFKSTRGITFSRVYKKNVSAWVPVWGNFLGGGLYWPVATACMKRF